jgi:hypothetical protein
MFAKLCVEISRLVEGCGGAGVKIAPAIHQEIDDLAALFEKLNLKNAIMVSWPSSKVSQHKLRGAEP